jgi:hypothetical protein
MLQVVDGPLIQFPREVELPSPTDPSDEDFDHASDRLDEGLKSCRAVVSGYRLLLVGDGRDEGSPAGFIGEFAGDEADPV